jgi:5'-3' exoribonuclease 4
MGIPSYYKKLIDTVPGLVLKNHPSDIIEWLFMDFNCLIYHCLYRDDTPPYPGDHCKEEWELQLCECIVNYCLKIIKEVNPKLGVYIAIDGVVPMAKMRQQRLRRFKSIWISQHSNPNTTSGPSWDKNSITPGTHFMKKLHNRLKSMIKKLSVKNTILSSSDEPGEGEHKIINEWRKGNKRGNYAVYGLDADLIILSILGHEICQLKNNIWLFREEVNAGKISYDTNGEEIFEWFSINILKDWLSADFKSDPFKQHTFILNYCFAMSVLGNDFLPSSLGLKIRDDGHSELLDIIKTLTSNNVSFLQSNTLNVSFEDVKTLFITLSKEEDIRIQKYICKKQMMANNLGQNLDGVEIKLGDNNWPLSHIEENVLIKHKQLIPNWKEKYLTQFFNGFSFNIEDNHRICKEYLYGIQWIWAYYTGSFENVCFNWVYPFNLPPLWIWLKEYLSNTQLLPSFPNKILITANDIRPIEQLALVLPLESWQLIPDGPEKKLPILAPQFYPSAFTFESTGKRYFWECESMIPLPSILEIKEIIRRYT